MKKFQSQLVLLAFLGAVYHVSAQEQYTENPIIFDSYISEETFIKNFPLPVIRQVKTGTKIIPVFEGSWNYEAEGAFRYACKIWEEAIPTTFPIVVKAIMDNVTPNDQYSEVMSTAYLHNESGGMIGQYMTSLLVQAKATMFGEETGQYFRDAGELQLDSTMFFTPEIQIIYYNYNDKIDNNCSFSIEGNTDGNHYDFVTMVLRDIGKGLGVTCSFKGARNASTGTRFLRVDKSTITPFEEEVLLSLGFNSDSCTWYNNATQGYLNVGGYSLYAPSQWDRERSLNYMMPNDGEYISQVLDYNFGKGSVVREIDDPNLQQKLFKNVLKWRGFIPVGDQSIANGMSEYTTSTANDIPYGADTLFIFDGINSYSPNSYHLHHSRLVGSQSYSEYQANTFDEYKKQFMPNYIPQTGGYSSEGFFVSVMKENGTWDLIYSWPFLNSPVEVEATDVVFHYNMSEYARTPDGKLRCRTVVYSENPSNRQNKVRYFHLDQLPNSVKVQPLRVVNSDDEYYRDVKIGLRNLEGVTRVVVSQWDEGETFPYVWDETDFDQGYFVATVDKELYTRFEIKAYNANGYTVTDTIMAPLEPVSELSLQLRYYNGSIQVSPNSSRLTNKNLISSFEIRPLNRLDGRSSQQETTETMMKECVRKNGNQIDVSLLPKGMYALIVYDIKGGKHEMKFVK